MNHITSFAAPSAPGHPTVKAVNSTSLTVKWKEPLEFNGPDPYYEVIQSEIAFSAPPPRVIEGTRFPGGGYYLFPPETIPQGVAFTGERREDHRTITVPFGYIEA